MNTIERWNSILQGRQKHVWGKSAGLSISVVDAIFNKGKASWDAIRAAMYQENVSPRWLGEGEGSPYIAQSFPCESLLAEHLKMLLEDEAWNAVLCVDTHYCGIVLHMPGQYERKEKFYDYQVTEIIGGPITRKIIPILQPLAQAGKLSTLNLQLGQLSHLITGYIGNYELFGTEETPGLLSHAESCNLETLSNLIPKSQDQQPGAIDMELLTKILAMVETAEIEENKQLTTAQKAKVIAAAYHQQKKSTPGEHLSPSHIASLLELA